MSDTSFRHQWIAVNVHRARESSLYQRSRLHVGKVLLVDVARVVLQYAVLHRLAKEKRKNISDLDVATDQFEKSAESRRIVDDYYRQQLQHRVDVEFVFLDLAPISDRLLQILHIYVLRPAALVMEHLVVPVRGGSRIYLLLKRNVNHIDEIIIICIYRI